MGLRSHTDSEEIQTALTKLIGLDVAAAHRAADMRMFHFGAMRPAAPSRILSRVNKPRGTVGEFALHIQCPWRLETENEILTGRSDLWEPIQESDEFCHDEWDYEKDGNKQDHVISTFFSTDHKEVVESLDVQLHGQFVLMLSGGCKLAVFPSGAVSEDWRFFRPNTNDSHLVVSGGMIERE